MKKNLSVFFTLTILLFFYKAHSQQNIFINEMMASNSNTITDATGDYADWFELYNSGASNFSLTGCYISNDLNEPELFRFSGNIQIPAKGYIILWASNDTTRGKTHVPFKLSASGESIFLYKPDGKTLLDSVSFGPQITDISYGRQTDGSSAFVFFKKATPGTSNNTSTGYKGVLNDISFSAPAGFYASPFSLNINSPDAGVKIIYTLDGSTPDDNNIAGTVYRYKNQYPENPGESPYPFLKDSFISKIYSAPLMITDVSGKPNHLSIKSSTYDDNPTYFPTTLVNKGTVLRAMAVKEGYISSPVKTATYFVTPGSANKYTLPLISIAISPNDMFSWDSGNYVAGTDFEKWRAKNPSKEIFHDAPANYRRDVTERASSIEMFNSNATSEVFQLNNGTGIHGAASRSKAQKSFRIYFRGDYGESDLDYKIFPDQSYKDYSRLILRDAGGDGNITHLCDMAIQAAVRHLNFNTQDSRPAVAFVDGEYWGILNIREYYDWHYFNQHYGIGEDDIDYLTNNALASEGDSTDYVKLRQYIADKDVTKSNVYDSITKRIDISNYIDYYASEIFYGNTDWPTNNINYFRKRVPFTPGAPAGLDGRYRWVMDDLDQGLGNGTEDASGNSMQRATGTNPDPTKNAPAWATVIIRKLTGNRIFRNQFITRYADLLNTSFQPDYIISVIKYYHDLLAPEMQEHILRWSLPASLYAWNRSVNKLDSFAIARPAYAHQHLRDYFSLGAEQKITLNVSDTSQGYIHINTVDITPAFPGVPKSAYPWTGLYYTEVPVTLIAKPKTGYRFSHWEGNSSSTNDSITVTLDKAKNFKAVFEKTETTKFIHYWHFNNLPDDDLTAVAADSTLTGNAFITYNGSGDGYMDATDDDEGSDINLQYGETSGKALRARNPSATRSIIINAPTTGYKKIMLDYASSRTSSGAEYQRVFYTVDGKNWILKQDSIFVSNPETEFALEHFDFTNIDAVNNNPGFAVKVQFFGDNATGSSGNNRFDNITVSGIADTSVLATQLINFNASLIQKDAVLNWSVANQLNTLRYEVQRSTDGLYFKKIGSTNITSNLNYSFIDKNAALLQERYVYYRLKVIDKDGNFVYSNTASVSLLNNNNLQIIPNPVQNYATIKFYSASVQKATMIIKSVNGQAIRTEQFNVNTGGNVYTFNTANLAKGIYLIAIKIDNEISTVRIVKQ